MSTAQMNLLISTNRIGTGLRANPVRGRVTKKRNISLFTERVDVDIQCPMQCVRVVVFWFQADIN
ncbi:hypothetical protein ECZU32_51910 [Escherichia coli]|nr:hypothetical protein A9D68_26430 [Escherichia coli]GHL67212.1 hypothetical protein ECZU32_51910 [Escherichia coli]